MYMYCAHNKEALSRPQINRIQKFGAFWVGYLHVTNLLCINRFVTCKYFIKCGMNTGWLSPFFMIL